MSSPGDIDPEKFAQFERDIEQRAADVQQRKQDQAAEVQAAGVSRSALIMRQRRQQPHIQQAERKAIKARDVAMRTLAKAHPEEFMAYVQEERKRLGLEPLQPRGKHRRTLEQRAHDSDTPTPQRPAPAVMQAECRHADHTVKKFPYGKFCGGCGKRL